MTRRNYEQGRARALMGRGGGGSIFIYWCSARLISFEINPFAFARFWTTFSLFQRGLKTRPKASVLPLKWLYIAFTLK